MKRTSATFVLVHGAWHGGWCWARVARLLRETGHAVFTPTLTGLGDRAHLAHRGVDLALHIQDVLGLLEMEEPRQVILVGHSYGGMVITGVAGRGPARLAHLVYLDAFVPASGQAVFDLLPAPIVGELRQAAEVHGDGWRIPPLPPERFGVTNAKDAAWLSRHLVPQPIRTFEQPVHAPDGARLERTYIHCRRPTAGPFDQFRHLKEDRAWRFHEVRTGHDAMVTVPGEITRLLLRTLRP
ncbi:MAG: alpha/beta fold hydrolase [Candidatus Rokubacteria bacterium]|nr:alpha/beta fold hydrolase [Candidatus Rokubacteria bacterium]